MASVERITMLGKSGFAAYVSKSFEPAEPDTADYVKVVFDDGTTLFLTPEPLTQDFDPDQPRDPAGSSTGGQWTATGAGIGHGYSQSAKMKNGKVYTDNVRDAARALYEGRHVVLSQPREVSTLLEHLGQVSKNMIRLGGKAPNFNLCNVSVKGTNLFCSESKGIPRIKMPQFNTEQTNKFLDHLKSKGYTFEATTEQASYLRATQSELNGAKVAATAASLRKDPEGRPKPLVVSRDNYLLDGHHTWAAKVGLDAMDNKLGDVKMKVNRVDIGIIELLHEAQSFEGKGRHQAFSGEAKPDIRSNLARMSKTDDGLQRVKTLDELYTRSKKDEPAFKADVQVVAKHSGGEALFSPPQPDGTNLKSRSSAERKMRDELDNDPRYLRDIMRATVVHKTIEGARDAAAEFIALHGDNIVRVKDRFVEAEGGYRDILINYRTRSGLVAEVQFNGQEMIKAKFGKGHRYYEAIRLLKAGRPPKEVGVEGDPKQLIATYEKEQTELYANAYSADGNGHWGRKK